jgi:hypothetical protein
MQVLEQFGKVREMKAAVVGVERIPDDPINDLRDKLGDYEQAIYAFRKGVARLERAISDFGSASTEIGAAAEQVVAGNSSGFSFLEGMYRQKIEEPMEKLKLKSDTLVAMHAGLAEKLRARDKAFHSKVHYEQKVNKLQTKPSGGLLSSFSNPAAQAERNDKKLEEATSEWLELDDQCRKEIADALANQQADSSMLVSMLEKLAQEFFTLSATKFTNKN